MIKGLQTEEAEEKLRVFGKNLIMSASAASPLSLFLSQFLTVLNALLGVAAMLSLILGDILDGVFIIAIVLLNAGFGFFQEYKAEKSLEKLKNLITPLSRVFRDGKEVEIETENLVPADVVILSEGDRIPADGKILQEFHLEVDESVLTGESIPVIKRLNDTLYKGTLIVKGKAFFIVEKTGMQTEFGSIAKTLATIQADKSPLQKRLDTLGKSLSLAAFALACLLLPIGIMQGKSLFPIILLVISVSVAAIPEGLPAVITIALAMGTNRMAKKQAIVRSMPSVETLGAVQILLFDKTGTITQNAMRVKKFWLKEGSFLPDLLHACTLGNTSSLVQKTDNSNSSWEVVGDRTDGALLLFAKEKEKSVEENEGNILDEYVFDPDTKTVSTVVEKEGKTIVYVRGAPEVVLERSRLTLSEKTAINKRFQEYAKEGLRIIGFGKKKEVHVQTDRSHLEQNLEFLGFVGIYDPPRNEAKQAVKEAKNAGVKPIMVTGDNPVTAIAIAKEVGLLEHGEDVVTGEDLKRLSDEELTPLLLRTRVFARVKPDDKLRLVTLFKKQGFVVGVTGDGVNDALALKRADVGIAMGETGTDVAKEAADIILTNDNFATIVHALEEGRRIYGNILKAITYLLSGNLSEICLVVFASLLGLPTPLLPTQILWINIVTDGLPALALASDAKDTGLLKIQPRNPHEKILTNKRLLFIIVVGLGIASLLLMLFFFLLTMASERFSRTVIFNVLIVLHLMIAFVVRGGSMFRPTRFLILAVTGTIVMQICITLIPVFQEIFQLGS